MKKNAQSPHFMEKCQGSMVESGTQSQTVGVKNTKETAVFNCDTMTYFLGLQCHNFSWADNPSTFGSN